MKNAGRYLSIACLAVLLVGLWAVPALAQDGGGNEPPPTMTAFQFIKYGGAIGGLIIVASIIGMGMSIERAINLKRDNIVPPDVLGQLEQLFDEEDFEEAMTVCEMHPCFLTNVVAAGLPKIGTSYEYISDAMQEVGDFEATKLQQSISYINFIVNVSPMLGLLGTVWGMIGAFNTIATSKTPPTPAELAGGIQQALVTTCMGIFVSIMFAPVYFYYRNKVQRMILEVSAIAEELMERFKE
ncbi:MAG: MotA/TolQ/ExbB proton channel family protein [Planctomycetota bacterium]|nr:MAG: MotA/TolQ/ExbB proton channel family protein [Planctomycetota bacterium]